MSGVAEVEAMVGKGMSLVQFSTPMASSDGNSPFYFMPTLFDRVRNHGSIPFFSWSSSAIGNYNHPDFTLRAIASGRQDTFIRQWAIAARDWGHPFFLRFNHEMNGAWFPWGERYGTNQPGDFVAAWRHVHDIFESVGATNVSWVWCPVADPYRMHQRLSGLYPGDSYVDWTCMDVYNVNAPWMRWEEVAGATYDEIMSIAPSKPMVIGETGSTEAGGSKAAWITDMFETLPSFPKVRGLIWYDASDAGYSDHYVDSSPSAVAAFGAALADPNVIGNSLGGLTGTRIAPPSGA
jgi:beta-mannanase